jgi:hypothetical protein
MVVIVNAVCGTLIVLTKQRKYLVAMPQAFVPLTHCVSILLRKSHYLGFVILFLITVVTDVSATVGHTIPTAKVVPLPLIVHAST